MGAMRKSLVLSIITALSFLGACAQTVPDQSTEQEFDPAAAKLAKSSTSPADEVDANGSHLPLVLAPDTNSVEQSLVVTLPKQAPLTLAGIDNAYQLSNNIISGAEPKGDEAFEALKAMGVKTVISVDGKAPEVDRAKKFGMRYVHIPIRYSTITDEQVLHFAKTMRELDGPFFVHCFHGVHRGPAMAAIGRIAVDGVSRRLALAEMRQWSGTATKYTGLYESVAKAVIPDAAKTKSYAWDFPNQSKLAGYRHAMAAITRVSDNLKLLKKSNWATTSEHPDIDAVHEANMMADLFEQTLKMDDLKAQPEEMQTWNTKFTTDARSFYNLLKEWRTNPKSDTTLEQVDLTFKSLSASCKSCHRAYRNN